MVVLEHMEHLIMMVTYCGGGDLNSHFEELMNILKRIQLIIERIYLKRSDLFIVCSSGIGTLDEFFDFLALKYLDGITKKIIIFNINHFYDSMMDML